MFGKLIFLFLVPYVAFAGFYPTDYEMVLPSQTDQVIGPVGGAGDLLQKLVINVTTAATGTVQVRDGNGAQFIVSPANTTIGVYSIDLGMRSVNGAWKITTGAGADVMAVGAFK